MSLYTPSTPTSIDAFLAKLRVALGQMPGNEADEILREFRSHILDRMESATAGENQSVTRILSEIGAPEDIGAQYLTDALVERARTTYSPFLIFRTTSRLAMRTFRGFLGLLLGVIGYGFGIPLVACAMLKPIFPNYIGLWIDPHGVELATSQPGGLGSELLGWWIIPIALVLGTLTIVGTTLLLRWMLGFASVSPRKALATV